MIDKLAGIRNCAGVLILLIGDVLITGAGFRGSLIGTVLDQSGGSIGSAMVTVTQNTSANVRKGPSNPYGQFRFEDLLPGSYQVVANAPGFDRATSVVAVPVSSAREITVIMKPSSVRETINVQGQGSSISTQPMNITSSVQGGVVDSRDLETIPLAHRSFANIAYLIPGTEPVEPSDPTKARITAVSFGGSSGLNDVLSVDGGDNSDDYIGGFLQNFSPDVIQ